MLNANDINWEESVGKKIKNKETGEICEVSAYMEYPIHLSNGESFQKGSQYAGEWELIDKVEIVKEKGSIQNMIKCKKGRIEND